MTQYIAYLLFLGLALGGSIVSPTPEEEAAAVQQNVQDGGAVR